MGRPEQRPSELDVVFVPRPTRFPILEDQCIAGLLTYSTYSTYADAMGTPDLGSGRRLKLPSRPLKTIIDR